MAKKATSRKSAAGSKTAKKPTPSRARKTSASRKVPGKAAQKTAQKPSKKLPAKAEKSAKNAKSVSVMRKSPLSKAQLKEFEKLLLAKRRDLVGDMNGIEAQALRTNRQDGSGDLSNMPTHPADIGTDNFEQEFTLGLLESERALLKEIDEALTRIKQGTFGVCVGTGKPISQPRLRARPWAKYCIEYARMIEKGLVRPGEEEPDSFDEDEGDEDEAEADDDRAPEGDSEGEVEFLDDEE
ncbi:MAG TPA: hypothetical protein DCX07_07425 [Phycisphaerales bacterium]|nr:hypothetical protein [Phycisphaerales bacterium]